MTTPPPATGEPRFATRRLLSDCVHCGLCLEACPTYRELGQEPDSPRGRLYLMKALAERRLEPDADVVRHLDLCLGCRACEPACPSGVHYGAVLEATRAWLGGGTAPAAGSGEAPAPAAADTARAAGHRRGLRDRLLRDVLVGRVLSDAALSRVAVDLLRFGARFGLVGLAGSLLPKGFDAVRWSRALAPTPRVAWSKTPGARRERTPDGRPLLVLPGTPPIRGRVAFLTGCVMDGLFGRTNEATTRVLTLEGWDVVLPEGTGCCGALAAHAGLPHRAAELGRATTRDFAGIGAGVLVVNAAGCGAHLKESGSPGLPVLDITEFLVRHPLRSPLGPPSLNGRRRDESFPLKVAYHDACHLAHAQRVTAPPRQLLAALPEVTVVPLADSDLCCGSAGSYNILEPEMAGRLGRRKAAAIEQSGAAVVTATNMGCLTQIQSHLGGNIVSTHIIELLDDAVRSGGRRP